MKPERITVETLIAASLDVVWLRWTDPDHITQWNFASDDWCCPGAASDLKVGGQYKARMEAKDGSFGFDFEAVYTKVEPQRAITLKMDDGRTARTTFEAVAHGTKVKTIFDAEAENSVEMQRSGWQAILNNFKKHAEKL